MADHPIAKSDLNLRDVAHQQCDELWNVLAVLEAAARVTEAGETADEEEANRVRRLVYVAEAQVRGVLEAFRPHI